MCHEEPSKRDSHGDDYEQRGGASISTSSTSRECLLIQKFLTGQTLLSVANTCISI